MRDVVFGVVRGVCRPADDRVLREVLEKRCYRRVGFDVEYGERWLDLGANVGAFALYCKSRGAVATCYEPEPECFELLRINAAGFELHRAATTASRAMQLPFYVRTARTRFSEHVSCARGTAGVLPGAGYIEVRRVDNVCARIFRALDFDGVKMDIEGSEGGILDGWLLPRCSKLVLEYHTSRDPNASNLERRLNLLRSRFQEVRYPAEYDRWIAGGKKPFADRIITCWGPR